MLYRKTWVAALAASSTVAACSPALDWREFEPEGSGVVVTFPCRPDRHARSVRVAGTATRMDMLVCAASEATYALTFIDVADPAAVTAALLDLRAVAVANLGASSAAPSACHVPGMTPNEQAAHLQLSGHRPDGTPVQQRAAFFAKGVRVYQASVVGAALSGEAVDTFFAGLRLPS